MFEDLSIDGAIPHACDPHTVFTPDGFMLAADGRIAEVATAPVRVGTGFDGSLAASAATARDRLMGHLPADVALTGASAHLNVSCPDRDADGVARQFARTFAPALMQVMGDSAESGLIVRPRPGRVELCGDFVDGEALQEAALLATGGVLACRDGIADDLTVDVTLEPGLRRYGYFVTPESGPPRPGHLDDAIAIAASALAVHQDSPLPPAALVPARRGLSVLPRLATWDWRLYEISDGSGQTLVCVPRRDAEAFAADLRAGRLDRRVAAALRSPDLPILRVNNQTTSISFFSGVTTGSSLLAAERPVTTTGGQVAVEGDRPGKAIGFITAMPDPWWKKGWPWLAGGGLVALIGLFLFSGQPAPETAEDEPVVEDDEPAVSTGEDPELVEPPPIEFDPVYFDVVDALRDLGMDDWMIEELLFQAVVEDGMVDLIYSISGIDPGDVNPDVDLWDWMGFILSIDDATATTAFDNTTFECGTNDGIRSVVCSGSGLPMGAGEIVVAAAVFTEPVGTDPSRFYQYAAVFDADLDPANNWQFQGDFDWDFWRDTDRWYTLDRGAGGEWVLAVRDMARRGDFTAAVAVVQNATIIWFIPASEFPADFPTMRISGFRHDGTFQAGVSAGDVSGADPTIAPVAVTASGVELIDARPPEDDG